MLSFLSPETNMLLVAGLEVLLCQRSLTLLKSWLVNLIFFLSYHVNEKSVSQSEWYFIDNFTVSDWRCGAMGHWIEVMVSAGHTERTTTHSEEKCSQSLSSLSNTITSLCFGLFVWSHNLTSNQLLSHTHTHTHIQTLSSLCLSGFIHSGSYVEGALSQTKFSVLNRVYGVVLYRKIKAGSLVLIPSWYPSGPAVYLLNQKFFVQVTNIFKKLSKKFSLYRRLLFFHLHHSQTACHYQNKDDLYKHLINTLKWNLMCFMFLEF